MKISILTPTIRPEGLEVVLKSLKRQTFKNYQWLVGSREKPELEHLTWVKDDFERGYWSLNRIYNKMIKAAKGDLIVSWQDYTTADPTALEKFWRHFNSEPKVCVGAVGNKYMQVFPYPMLKVWQDPRERNDQGSYYEVYPNDLEWNLCSVPKQALYDVGGFDEGMDFLGFGMDGVSVNQRMDDVGYRFKLDQSIKSYSLKHGRPDGWDENNMLGDKYKNRRNELIENKEWPKLEYLIMTKDNL